MTWLVTCLGYPDKKRYYSAFNDYFDVAERFGQEPFRMMLELVLKA